MTDRNVIPFPGSDREQDDDREIVARLSALYASTPAPDAAQIERCVRGVLAESLRAPTRQSAGIARPRWWWAAAAAAALIVVVAKPWRVVAPATATTAQRTTDSLAETLAATLAGSVTPMGGDAVRFDLHLPTSAREVALVGDFNGWNEHATPMAHGGRNGTWSTKIPLAPGRHVYAFVVDGKKWLVDPLAPQVPDDGLGPTNAVVVEGLPK